MSILVEIPNGTSQPGSTRYVRYRVTPDTATQTASDSAYRLSVWTIDTSQSATANDAVYAYEKVILEDLDQVEQEQEPKPKGFAPDNTKARSTFSRLFRSAKTFVALFPTQSGFINRSDFLEYRLQGPKLFEEVIGFTSACQHVRAESSVNGEQKYDRNTLSSAHEQLTSALGVVVLSDDLIKNLGVEATLQTVTDELANRLSFPWLFKEPLARQRIAWVDGRKSHRASDHIWTAAAALGIDLVMLDKPGHWLEPDNGPYSHLREAFVPVDITADPDLAQRLVAAVKSYPQTIHGIATVSDLRLAAVARAAEMLGLPGSSPSSFLLAMDKHKTRAMEEDASAGSCRFTTLDALSQALSQPERPFGAYPLIVKPCLGWSSEGVTKVANDEELLQAFTRAVSWRTPLKTEEQGILVETYIDGPEFDANFVLQDGKVLFCEIGDNFPGAGDGKGYHSDLSIATGSQNFQETELIYPSSLPQAEQDLIRKSIEKSILRQGFRDGVFHCEGRMRDSSVQYQRIPTSSGEDQDDYLIDLAPVQQTRPADPSVYLLEINARPPGYPISPATKLGCGVDYYALQLLQALPDATSARRYASLAQPFLKGPQYQVLVEQYLPSHGGIMRSEAPWSDLESRRPDLANADNVPFMIVYKKAGDKVAGPGEPGYRWVAYGVIVSRETRDDVQILAKDIRREFRYVID